MARAMASPQPRRSESACSEPACSEPACSELTRPRFARFQIASTQPLVYCTAAVLGIALLPGVALARQPLQQQILPAQTAQNTQQTTTSPQADNPQTTALPAPAAAQVDPVGTDGSESDQTPADAAQADTALPPEQTPAQELPPTATEPSAEERAQAELRRKDRDGDNRLSRHESSIDAKAQFDTIDADRNYHISDQEMADWRNVGKPIGEQISGTDAIRAVDANNNGEATITEYENNANQEFRMRDINGDDYLDEAELQSSSSSLDNTPPTSASVSSAPASNAPASSRP